MFDASSPSASLGDVLIIEDEADIRDLIQYNLERAGFKTRTAKNGQMSQIKLLSSDEVSKQIGNPLLHITDCP